MFGVLGYLTGDNKKWGQVVHGLGTKSRRPFSRGQWGSLSSSSLTQVPALKGSCRLCWNHRLGLLQAELGRVIVSHIWLLLVVKFQNFLPHIWPFSLEHPKVTGAGQRHLRLLPSKGPRAKNKVRLPGWPASGPPVVVAVGIVTGSALFWDSNWG